MPAEPMTDTVSPVAAPGAARSRPHWTIWLGLLVAVWVLTMALYLVRANPVLPGLVLLGTAALVHGGSTLVDRLVLALGLLVGATCAFGLLWSVWPWGLHPAPVSGSALSALVMVAALTGRRPRLPRPGWSDLLAVGATILMVVYLSRPYRHAFGFTQRLGILMSGEDNARHEAAFDVIGRIGGYLFVRQDEAREHIFSGMIYYPQGWHLTTALLDGFVRRPSGAPGGPAAFDHYIFWTLATFGFLLLVLLWATLWVAGRMHLLQQMFAAAVVTALALGTELPRLLVRGYPGEALGLSLALIVAALAIRPLARRREQLIVVGTLLIGVGFVYYLFLLPAGLVALCWLVRDRRKLRGRRSTVVLMAVLTCALAPITAVCGLLLGGQSEALIVVGRTGTVYTTILVLGTATGLGLLARSRWREEVWRRYLVAVMITLAFAVAVGAANVAAGVSPGYYFIKTVHLSMALLITGVAASARLLPVPEPCSGWRGWCIPTGLAALAAVAVLTASGVFGWYGGFFQIDEVEGRHTTWSAGWSNAIFQRQRQAAATMVVYRSFPPEADTVTLVMDVPSIDGYRESVYLSSLQGTSAQTESGIYIAGFSEPARLREVLRRVPGSVRLVAVSAAAEGHASVVLTADPALRDRVTVIRPPS